MVARMYCLGWLLPYITLKQLLAQRRANLARSRWRMEQRIQLGTGHQDFWDSVIEKSGFERGMGMSREEMTRNADLLVLGGSETTATLLAGTTYLLLKNPRVMKKVVDEVRTTFKAKEEIDAVSVNKLDYMLAVLDEALRIYPPVTKPGNRRVPPCGAFIAGRWVPGGTSVQFQIYSAPYSSSNFHLPECFLPERWLPNQPAQFANDDRAARAPFSAGPRNCIGSNLAYAEMRLILAKVLWNFDVELDERRCGEWSAGQKVYGLWEKGAALGVFEGGQALEGIQCFDFGTSLAFLFIGAQHGPSNPNLSRKQCIVSREMS
ncbi:Nn.00g062350.m01.CDS01 [Neocucurbitaria sp. VM-36]